MTVILIEATRAVLDQILAVAQALFHTRVNFENGLFAREDDHNFPAQCLWSQTLLKRIRDRSV